MKRPKIIVVDKDYAILDLLGYFLTGRGYEIMFFNEPSFCTMFKNPDTVCTNEGCADVLIIDCQSYESGKLRLLKNQEIRGCKMNSRNKAIISTDIVGDLQSVASGLGCTFFEKPFRLLELAKWLDDCTTRVVTRCEC